MPSDLSTVGNFVRKNLYGDLPGSQWPQPGSFIQSARTTEVALDAAAVRAKTLKAAHEKHVFDGSKADPFGDLHKGK